MTKISKTKKQQIANHYGYEHVRRQGNEVYGYGSSDPYNRQRDYWHLIGTVSEVLAELDR